MADQPFPEPPPLSSDRPEQASGIATASLVLGLLSCVFSCLTGIPAIICGAIGLKRIGDSGRAAAGPRLTGQGMALAGIILGCTTLITAPIVLGLLLPAVQAAREAAHRVGCSANVRRLALGMLNIESEARFLPAAIVTEDGKPLLSWRVAILPYIEEGALYEQFHLDEPWDSEHNLKLLPLMPSIYVCPGSSLTPGDGKTSYLAAAGPGMALSSPPARGRGPGGALLSGVPMGALADGPSKTVLVLEVPAKNAVPWTKPEDFTTSPAEAAGRLFTASSHQGGFHMVAFGDTHVSPITEDVAPAVLAAILTRDGAEPLTLDE